MGTALRKAQKRANRLGAMNKQIDAGGEFGIAARQVKRLLSNTWTKRNGSPGAFHNPGKANRSAFTLDRLSAHLVTKL